MKIKINLPSKISNLNKHTYIVVELFIEIGL